MISNEALRVLENNLAFVLCIDRQFDNRFGVAGAKIGNVFNARKPVRYVGRTGQAINIENSTETEVPIVLTTQFGVDMQASSADYLLSIDEFSSRIIKPAVATIANKIDYDSLQMFAQVWNTVGTAGTVPSALLTYLQAGAKLDNNAAPRDDMRYIVINSLMQAVIVDALKGLFQAAMAIAEQYRLGQMGTVGGFDWYMDQNVASFTTGLLGGSPQVNGSNQTGSSLITNGWTSAATQRLNVGDIFTVAVDSVNPQNRQDTGQLLQFVVQAPASSDANGNMTISVAPPITPSGQFQTATASPANGAALTIGGGTTNVGQTGSWAGSTVTPQGIAFHHDAFTLASAPLPIWDGVDMSSRAHDKQLGISIRFMRAGVIQTDQLISRLDVLYGPAALRPEIACRVAS